jgi:hypothetical protein
VCERHGKARAPARKSVAGKAGANQLAEPKR